MTPFDAIVIGTGQSGPALAARLGDEGWKVAVIERDRFGGTCVNDGCTPTKTMVASAKAIQQARAGDLYGFSVPGGVEVDMKKVRARKNEIAGASNEGVENWMKSADNLTVFEGDARFVAPNRISVNGETLEAPKIFLNVGARASVPPLPGIERIDYYTSENIMDIDFLPHHLVVLGGSYIGLEFAQMFRRFGSEVTVIQRGPRLISREDEDIADAVREIFEEEGIEVLLGIEETEFARQGDEVSVDCKSEGGKRRVTGSHLLVALGRKPNTDGLGLDAAGVEVDKRGYIEVDDQLKTSAEGVWALGDCNGRGAFTHTSYNDYEIVAANLLDDDPRRVSDRITTYALFIDPPLGRVGMTEAQARERGGNLLVGKLPMSSVGRAREAGQTRGFMKVLVDADSERILGAAILGLSGDEAIHCITDVMYADAPYTVIRRAVHIHPTVAELIPTLLGDLEPLEG